MTLTNLTFGNTKNKTLLCSFPGSLQALTSQLSSLTEEVVQVSASVLRNLSWRAEESCRKALREVGAIPALLGAAQSVESEAALRTTLSALWNLSAHCSENKAELCTLPSALKFLVKSLSYCSPAGNLSVVESSGGIIRNLSSHIAVRPECRQTLRDNNCFHTLLAHLRSPSLRIVSNACGALWNLSARCVQDQQLLWELGAVSLLKSLVNSKHKAISTASSAALRNLMAIKPVSVTDTESVASSRLSRRYRSLPASSRAPDEQAQLKAQAARSKAAAAAVTHSSRAQSPTQPKVDGSELGAGKTANVDHGLPSAKAAGKENPPLVRSRSDMCQRAIAGRQRRNKVRTGDTSSVDSGTSLERSPHFPKWSDSVDSLAKQRRQAKNPSSSSRRHAATTSSPRTAARATREPGHAPDATVIQLVSDKYPLQVSVKPARRPGDSARDKTVPEEPTRLRGRLLCPRQNEAGSVASPASSRRLNQWTSGSAAAAAEAMELDMRGRGERHEEALRSPGSSRSRRRHAAKFKSYRDSESEPEADVDSEDERKLFKPRRLARSSQQPGDADSAASSNCSCDELTNVWIRRGPSSGPGRLSAAGPTTQGQRDSANSSPSSPNAPRGIKAAAGRTDGKKKSASKSVKVTSL